jgi:hypothetical protein
MTDVRQQLRGRREVLDHVLTLLRRGHTTRANAVEAMNRACGVLDPQAGRARWRQFIDDCRPHMPPAWDTYESATTEEVD